MSPTSVFLGALLVLGTATAQRERALLGEHPLVVDALPPRVAAVSPAGRALAADGDLAAHPALGIAVTLEPGRKDGQFRVRGKRVRPTRLKVPGELTAKLEFGRRGRREHRWRVTDGVFGVGVESSVGLVWTHGERRVLFVDGDHDGVFGLSADRWIALPLPAGTESVQLRTHDEPFVVPAAADGAASRQVWFRVAQNGLTVRVVNSSPPSPAFDEDQWEALLLLNDARAALGFDVVRLDDELSVGCLEHSRYCARHGQTHVQNPAFPGHTTRGATAGENGVLMKSGSIRHAVQVWRDSFFHRIDMLMPGLRRVGMGAADGQATMDVKSACERVPFEAFAWPPDGMRDVPRGWQTGEVPSPLGPDRPFEPQHAKAWGYPITLTFPTRDVHDVAATVRVAAAGEPLEAFVSTPAEPSQPAVLPHNNNTILVMPKGRLRPSTEYEVTVRARVDGAPFERRWRFRTR